MLPSINHLSGLIFLIHSSFIKLLFIFLFQPFLPLGKVFIRDAIFSLTLFVQAAKAKRKVVFKRAESYVKEYLSKEKEEIRLKRAARTAGDFYVPAEPKVYFVIRIRG